MTPPRPPWSATVRVRTARPEVARWLEAALAPEAAREVPRSRAALRRERSTVTLDVTAADSGAMRAALNTFLGWVSLSLETVSAAERRAGDEPAPRDSEAVISRTR